MNKKILTVAVVAPLLYTACSNSANLPTSEAAQKIETTAVETRTVETNTIETAKAEIVNNQINTEISTPLNTSIEATVNYANNNESIKKKGMLHIKSFMGTLKPTLMSLMQSDPTHKTALGGCSSMAQKMTDDYNAVSPDTKIRRTALRYRNEKNRPDATDTTVMERFLASNDFSKPLVVEMPTHYRVYKALAIKQACLACHGTNISKDLQEMLVTKYPTDMATNFKLGEFRGVVVAEVQK